MTNPTRYEHIMRPDCPLPSGASVVAYCRDSGNEDQDRSVGQQQEAIREYCTAHGLVLERIYTDAAKSGGSAETRTALNEMLFDLRARFKPVRDRAKRAKQAESKPFGVVMWKSNRLSRDSMEATHIKSDLRMRGLTLISLITQGETGDEGLNALLESFQQYQDEKALLEISENSKRGLTQLVSLRDTDPVFRAHNPNWPTRDGRYLGIAPGTKPAGFKGEKVVTGVNRRGEVREAQRLVRDPEKWGTVRLAWEMRNSGAGIAEIHRATKLFKNAAGYASMFRNRLYTGDFWYGGKLYEGFVEPMIPLEWWEAEQVRIGKRAEMRAGREAVPDYHPRRVSSNHPLSGLVWCACNSQQHHPMHVESVPVKKGRGSWTFYICSVAKSSRGVRCSMPRVSAKALEKSVIDWVLNNLLTIDAIRPLATDLARELSSGNHEAELRLSVAERQLVTVTRAIEHILNMLEERGSSDSLETRLRKREGEQRELTADIKRLRAVVEASKAVIVPSDNQLREWVESISAALTGEDVTLVRHTLRTLVHRVEVETKEKAILHYAAPLFSPHVHAMPSANSAAPTERHPYTRHQSIKITRLEQTRAYAKKDLTGQRREAKRLFDLGLEYRDIGRKMGVSRQTAWNWVNDESA